MSSSTQMGNLPENAGSETSLRKLEDKPSYETFLIGGLPVHVFGMAGVKTKQVTVLFFLHGRLGKWEDGIAQIQQMLQTVTSKNKSLIVVTFDQRNHGHRHVDKRANSAWADKPPNPLHAQDMHSIQMGTASDVSLLIDYLNPYVFPKADHIITQYLCAGISLGGHSTWLVLSHEPRIQAGCPIIGCPDFMTLMSGRAEALGGMTKEMMPDSLRAAVSNLDPKTENMKGKRILILSGKKDKLVPFDKGAAFVEEVKKVAASVQIEIYEGVGHRCTPEMIDELCKFISGEMNGSLHRSSSL